jgi:hypothetical protein
MRKKIQRNHQKDNGNARIENHHEMYGGTEQKRFVGKPEYYPL